MLERPYRAKVLAAADAPLRAAVSNGAPVLRMPDDGDEQHFCSTCAFGSVCMPHGVDKAALAELHCLVEHVGPYRAGERIFHAGDRFGAIYAVRGGTVKTSVTDD